MIDDTAEKVGILAAGANHQVNDAMMLLRHHLGTRDIVVVDIVIEVHHHPNNEQAQQEVVNLPEEVILLRKTVMKDAVVGLDHPQQLHIVDHQKMYQEEMVDEVGNVLRRRVAVMIEIIVDQQHIEAQVQVRIEQQDEVMVQGRHLLPNIASQDTVVTRTRIVTTSQETVTEGVSVEMTT